MGRQGGNITPTHELGGGGKTDLSEATLYRLAAILKDSPLRATVSPQAFDSAMAVGL